ncbi:MAG: hypothetical protein HWN65_22250 [Candidatus Helarchaeota archaeon]|nr:hypothetical protein [Candidatus Helarchaeota archaeon]
MSTDSDQTSLKFEQERRNIISASICISILVVIVIILIRIFLRGLVADILTMATAGIGAALFFLWQREIRSSSQSSSGKKIISADEKISELLGRSLGQDEKKRFSILYNRLQTETAPIRRKSNKYQLLRDEYMVYCLLILSIKEIGVMGEMKPSLRELILEELIQLPVDPEEWIIHNKYLEEIFLGSTGLIITPDDLWHPAKKAEKIRQRAKRMS